jgi:hypothetical protein
MIIPPSEYDINQSQAAKKGKEKHLIFHREEGDVFGHFNRAASQKLAGADIQDKTAIVHFPSS